MEFTLYSYALCASLTLMLFFACRFIFGTLPEKKNIKIYKQSRSIMGVAMLILSLNYSIHLFISPRYIDSDLAIYINLSTYFLVSWLFSSALMHLMVRGYLSHRRFIRNIIYWLIFTASFFFIWISAPDGTPRLVALIVMSAVFVLYCVFLASRLFMTMHRLKRMLDSYHSDYIYAYVRWMSIFTYWAIIFGVGQGLFTFIPNKYVYLWIISAIPFYVYTYIAYKNYYLFYDKVEKVCEETVDDSPTVLLPQSQDDIIHDRLQKWIAEKGFIKSGLTIADLAKDICTNRTYISSYINNHYNVSFREWINSLRLEYAKQLLVSNSEMTIADVAQAAGYLSLSYFTKTFTLSEGTTPGKWRRLQ